MGNSEEEAMKITELPLADVPKEWRERFTREVWNNIVQEGRDYRRLGYPSNAPIGKYLDNDMAVSWQMGWHQQDAIERARPRRRR